MQKQYPVEEDEEKGAGTAKGAGNAGEGDAKGGSSRARHKKVRPSPSTTKPAPLGVSAPSASKTGGTSPKDAKDTVCFKCPLIGKTRINGEGVGKKGAGTGIMFIGEAPGEQR